MRLVDGAEAIRGDLPSAATHVVEVPLEAGDEVGTGILRAGSLRIVAERTGDLLARIEGPAITIGGDCGVSLAAIGHANARANGGLAVVWLDAHPDLNSPATSPSGSFTGMVLRALTGDGVEGLVPQHPVDPARVILAGAREFDPGEHDFVREHAVAQLGVDALADPQTLVAAIEATGASWVYLHIDVDVLDPAEIRGVGSPVPFGLTAGQLSALIRAVRERFDLAGATIAEFAPASPDDALDDLPTILRLIGALTA